MRSTLIRVAIVVCAAQSLAAQAPPSTDIYVVPLTVNAGRVSLGAPRNVTNRPGYDNQPAWSARGDALYFSSQRGDGQSDIWNVAVATGAQTRVTSTSPESEYSPTLIENGAALSVVRVERDSAQRLWRFPLDGGAPSVILPEVRRVGYHAWIDGNTLALFILGAGRGDPATLQIGDTRTGAARVVARNVGRCIAQIPGANAVSYVDKALAQEWWITRYDVATGVATQIARTLPGVEDYAWTPGGALLAANDAHVFEWTKSGWAEIADLSGSGVAGITRMAASPRGDQLAFVARDKAP